MIAAATPRKAARRVATCPYCGGEISIHPDSVLPRKPSPYFRRLQDSDHLAIEIAGMFKSAKKIQAWIEKILAAWDAN